MMTLPAIPHAAEEAGAGRRFRGRLRAVERRGAVGVPAYLGSALLGVFAFATLAAGVIQGGHLSAVGAALGMAHHVAGRLLGFGVERITVTGLTELTADEVLTTGSVDVKRGLPFLDADAIRERIAGLPLVEQVSVQKLYPADLVIKLSERKPFALWQHKGNVAVVSRDGVVIDRDVDARFVGLPLAVGEGANLRVGELAALLEAAGDTRGLIRAGILVGERRWNLKLTNGIDVKLPEEHATDAVRRMVALQRKHQLLDRDVLVIDLRDPDRVSLRLTPEAAEQRREAIKAKLGKWKGSNT